MMNLGSQTELHHEKGIFGCFVNGSVRFLHTTLAAKVRQSILSINGSEKVNIDEF